MAYNNLGNIYSSEGNSSEALKYFLAALKILQEAGDIKRISVSYSNIGNVYYDQANYSEALKYYFDSLKIAEEIGDNAGIAIFLQQHRR